MTLTSIELVQLLKLKPHPEGGYYKETYRSAESIGVNGLPERFNGLRQFSTAIYFLIEKHNFSAFHRIKSDEIWHFYAGNALEVIEIEPSGNLKKTLVGSGLTSGEVFQHTVPAGNWFASRVKEGGEYSLVGCTVSPGFDFQDFEMASRAELISQFPSHETIITELTRS
jgi:uncharacterized protein